jgi:hypothetical protein
VGRSGSSCDVLSREPGLPGIKQKGQPMAALFSSLRLFLEAAAEPIFHAAGEGTTGTLAAALACAR